MIGLFVNWALIIVSLICWTVLDESLFSSHCSGRNESAPISACKTFAEAQDIYRRTDWDGDGVLEYSQSITGANSLYEKNAGTGDVTLVDSAFAHAEGAPGVAQPKAGYVFKILKGQGPNAPGGQKSYLDEKGNMTRGYALVACPASYDGTGRCTFLDRKSVV